MSSECIRSLLICYSQMLDFTDLLLFSATLSYRVMELTYEFMNLPEFIAVAPEEITVEGIEQKLYHVGKDKKLPLLLGFLEKTQ